MILSMLKSLYWDDNTDDIKAVDPAKNDADEEVTKEDVKFVLEQAVIKVEDEMKSMWYCSNGPYLYSSPYKTWYLNWHAYINFVIPTYFSVKKEDIPQMMKKLEMARNIHRYWQELLEKKKNRKKNPTKKQEAKKLRKQLLTYKEISERLWVSYVTAWNMVNEQ